MGLIIVIGILSLIHLQLVVAQVTVVQSPSDVTACTGGTAEFSCAFQFASGTPTGATWFRNGSVDVSSAAFHVITDDSNDATMTPATVTTRLLISNLTQAGNLSGVNYLCDEDGVRSNPATLTIISDRPFETVSFGIPATSIERPASPDTLTFQLYRSVSDEIVNSIFLQWSIQGGPILGNMTLDPSTASYVIDGLSPDTTYSITVYLENACGMGSINSISLTTGPPNGDRPSVSPTTTFITTTATSIRQSINPTFTMGATPRERGSAVGMQCSVLLLMLTTLMTMIAII